MRGFRLFERPLGTFTGLPPLMLVGVLPDYESGAAYEGRLNILNGIGKCHAELLDNNLPSGAHVLVDNFNKQVIVRWPEYSPPTTEATTIVNGDFQERDLAGWRDVRGNSWAVEQSTDLGTGWATPEDYVAVMRGVGRGDHILESDLYPATPGEMVWARSLWDQGPSNKDNNNLWTAIQFYDRFKNPFTPDPWYQWYGDRIHDRTNKSRHYSTVEVRTPPNAAFKTVRLVAQRRNGRNRWIAVDNVETRGFNYSVGAGGTDDFYLTVRVTDSANRKATWSGILWNRSFWLASNVYPQYASDRLNVVPLFESASTAGALFELFGGTDSLSITALFESASTRSTFVSQTQPEESILVTPLFLSASTKSAFIQHGTQSPEALSVLPFFTAANTARILVSNTSPTNAIRVTPIFVGASTQ